MRIIIILALALAISGCGINSYITNKACDICEVERVCQVPPPLELVPQPALTLPNPSAQLVKPDDEDAYFILSQKDFNLWVDNNKKLENYIRECNDRNEKIFRYYEDGLEYIRME